MSFIGGYFSSTETVQSLYSNFTAGSVIFQDTNFLTQNNANFFWDNTNIRLGIGTATPTSALQIVASAAGQISTNITNSSASTSASLSYNLTNQNGVTGQFSLFANNFVATYLSNATRVAGSQALWLSSDVNVANGGADNIVFSAGGYNNIIAQVTPTQMTAVNYQDTGIAATNAGAPLSINSSQVIVPGITNTEVTATASATTTSATDAVITGMTTTPAAGTYLVLFCGAININSAGATVTVSLYVGGTQKAASVQAIAPFDGGTFSSASASCSVSINSIVTVTGSQAVAVEWHTSAGTATCGPRTLDLIRIA